MFKVLVVAYYFPPKGLSGVQRTLKFVKYLPKYNWQPTVITSENNAYYAYDEGLMDDLKDKDIRIVPVSAKDISGLMPQKGAFKMPSEAIRKVFSFFSSFFFIPDNKKAWSRTVAEKISELLREEKFDLIFVTGPPFSAVASMTKLKRKFRIPVVIDYRDLWYGYYFAIYPTPFHKTLIKRMEYKALRAADKIVVVNRRIKEKIMETYPFVGHNDVVIISHGYDKEDFERAKDEPKMHNKIVLTHSGLFYEYITPKYLLKAFKKLSLERPEIASNFRLQFIGVIRSSIQRLIKHHQLQTYVESTGYLSHQENISKIKASDLLWVMIGKARNSDAHTPSKFYEYIGTKKPVIGFVPPGALMANMKEYGASYICGPYDIEAIKDLLIEVHNDYFAKRLPQPPEEIVAKYDRELLTEALVKEFQFLIHE